MIIGAGLAGLITAHAFPNEPLVDAMQAPTAQHKAVLRFRGRAVGELTGIDFQPVTVRKGIWFEDQFCNPTIRTANLYAVKVIGRICDRSIWAQESVIRYVAPESFYEQLLDNVGARISWGVEADYSSAQNSINTAPLPVALAGAGISTDALFLKEGITVLRYRIPKCSVYQTVYFPSQEHTLYRASITGNLLICEFSGTPSGLWEQDVVRAFSIDWLDAIKEEACRQSFGKIAPIDEETRRSLISTLTSSHKIYSVGRFATWRNILLDDVVHDISVVKRLRGASLYEQKIIAAK